MTPRSEAPAPLPDATIDRIIAFLRGVDHSKIDEPVSFKMSRTRSRDRAGRQLVVIDDNLTYDAPYGFIEIGDVVELPPIDAYGELPIPWVGRVTALETTYSGPTRSVLRVVERAHAREG